MEQKNIGEEKDWKKLEIIYDEDEQIMLDVGENIAGILERKFSFTNAYGQVNWGYVIRVKGDKVPKLLFGSTILNRKMMDVGEGVEVMIERVKDIKTKNNPKTKNYEVYIK